jgi:uncharacterized cysteine cluster protein YcgN (CxxCxxCC family)
MCKLNREWRKELEKERERLVVMVRVVVHLVNHLKRNDPSCRCGANREDSYHIFFDCSDYVNMRYKLFHNLSWLPNDCAIDLKLLTSGNPILSNEQNE